MLTSRNGRALSRTGLFAAILATLFLAPFNSAMAQNGVAVIGPTTTSTPYACTTGGIQSAISDAINLTSGITQSVVDASNCTTLTITSEIDVGTGSTAVNSRIKLILPANGTWTASMTDGTSYALKWGDGAMIYGGTGSGEGQPFTIAAGNGSNLAAVCGNDPTYGTYFHAEGFSCASLAGSTIQHAVIEIANSADEAYLGHVTAAAYGTQTRALWVFGSCCSTTIEDVNAEGGGTANTSPCVFGNGSGSPIQGNNGIHVSEISCVHPGTGDPAMLLFQTGSSANAPSNTFKDIFMEQLSGNSDTGTPWVAVRQVGAAFSGADLLEGLHTGLDVSGSHRCVADLGSGTRVNISNLQTSTSSTCAIYDNTGSTGIWTLAPVSSVLASYTMTPLILGATTVSSLPAANQNYGAMLRVSDSTSIASEGQTCAGGGSTNALAFSNGSVWKCF